MLLVTLLSTVKVNAKKEDKYIFNEIFLKILIKGVN